MCTYNSKPDEVLKMREGPPAITAYKAVNLVGGDAYSQRGYKWNLGWNAAATDITESGIWNVGRAMVKDGCQINGGAIHVSRTLAGAKRWIKDSQGSTPLNAVIEVMVNPAEIVGMGEANYSSIIDIATRRCYVKSFKPVYRYTREDARAERRAAVAKLKAKRRAKLKAKKKRKK